MADITLNSAVRSNLRNLQSATDLISQTSERLSTGKKVNSAFDNPGSFFTAQALDRRSSDLTGLLDNVSNSVKTLEAADNGIKAITDVVEGLKATARQAAQSPKGAAYVAEGTGADATIETGGAFTFSVGDPDGTGANAPTNYSVTIADGDSIATVAKKINDSDSGVSAKIEDGELTLQSDVEFEVTATVDGTGIAAAAVDELTIIDQDAYDKRQGYLEDFNAALSQIDSLAKDASFNGVNLLQSDDLEIVFNEDGTSKLDVKGTNFDSGGIGLSTLSGSDLTAGAQVPGAFDTKAGIDGVLDQIDSAFATLEAQSSKFGSQLQIVQTRETFTKDMIGTLDDGSLALVGADTNEEAANLATLQTRQALIVSSLSISTQQESNVLQLLR